MPGVCYSDFMFWGKLKSLGKLDAAGYDYTIFTARRQSGTYTIALLCIHVIKLRLDIGEFIKECVRECSMCYDVCWLRDNP